LKAASRPTEPRLLHDVFGFAPQSGEHGLLGVNGQGEKAPIVCEARQF
jgi:4-hydroxy-L-threonine phosphate dehydrogenase PdxA